MKQFLPLALVSLLAVAVLGGYFFVLAQVDTSVARIGNALAGADALTKKDVTLQATEVFLNEINPLREQLEDTVVAKDDVVAVIQLLEDLARTEGTELEIANVRVEAVPAWQYHDRAVVTFSLDGSFAEIISFLGVLESLPQVARVEQGALEKSGTRSWFGTFTITAVKDTL